MQALRAACNEASQVVMVARILSCAFAAGTFGLGLLACNAAWAQQSTTREVSQALPSLQLVTLRDALSRLAQNPQNPLALVEAGDASLAVGDLDAAEGFFGRALQLDETSTGAKLGLASVYLRSRRPNLALQMFAEAEQAGASVDDILGDWGLAQDLLGNNELAQQSYRTVLSREPSSEISRRLAISSAISGDRDSFEEALRPWLDRSDRAAFRTRAFGLAILGDTDEAGILANQLLPPDLSSRIAPYLEYMPRLTKAQQAAAANLGLFPRAADIGRDVASQSGLSQSLDLSVAQAGSRLAPQGAPLDQRVDNSPPAEIGESRLAQVAREQASVADAFSGLIAPEELAISPEAGAVDITSLEIPRETVEPEPPAHPSRHWVQMATGRNRSALAFDWRKMVRRAPELLDGREIYTARYGRTNRLLTGPFSSRDDARELVRNLRRQGFDSFAYTSPEGQEVNLLQ